MGSLVSQEDFKKMLFRFLDYGDNEESFCLLLYELILVELVSRPHVRRMQQADIEDLRSEVFARIYGNLDYLRKYPEPLGILRMIIGCRYKDLMRAGACERRGMQRLKMSMVRCPDTIRLPGSVPDSLVSLTTLQQRFVIYYVGMNCKNASRAYVRAKRGDSAIGRSGNNAAQLKKNPNVRRAISDLKEIVERGGVVDG